MQSGSDPSSRDPVTSTAQPSPAQHSTTPHSIYNIFGSCGWPALCVCWSRDSKPPLGPLCLGENRVAACPLPLNDCQRTARGLAQDRVIASASTWCKCAAVAYLHAADALQPRGSKIPRHKWEGTWTAPSPHPSSLPLSAEPSRDPKRRHRTPKGLSPSLQNRSRL